MGYDDYGYLWGIKVVQTGRFCWEWAVKQDTIGISGLGVDFNGVAHSQSSAIRRAKRSVKKWRRRQLWADHPYRERWAERGTARSKEVS